jgi:hypothetical protein
MVHKYILIYVRNWLRILGKQHAVIFKILSIHLPDKEIVHSLRVGSRNLCSSCVVVSVFWLWRKMVFGFPSVLRIQYMMAHRNTDD